MLSIYKYLRNLSPMIEVRQFFKGHSSSIHTSAISSVKEIHVKEVEAGVTTVEGSYVESPRENLLVKTGLEDKKVCPLCALNLNLKHTDVLILSQFLRSDGCLLPRRITGLCNRQQKVVQNLVAMCQKAGLMSNIGPSYSKKDPTLRFGSRKLNRYFDETTIRFYRPKFPKRQEKVLPDNYHLYLQKYKKECF